MPSPVQAPGTVLESAPRQPQLASLGWALRRAALWLAIMVVMVVLGAWLFYASIDFDEASASTAPAAESAPASR